MKKKYLFIILFILLLSGITLGYSRLLETLSIDGDVTVSPVNFDIRLKELTITDGSFLNEGNNTSSIDINNNKKVNFNVSLSEPNQFYEFTFKIANQGTMGGYLTSITETGTTIEEINSNDNIFYSVETLPVTNDYFNVSMEKTIKIRIEFIGEEATEPFLINKSFEFSFSKDPV